MIDLRICTVGYYDTNCYIFNNQGSNKCIVVDPGFDGEKITEGIKSAGLEVAYVLITHGHGDHIGGIIPIKEAFPDCKVLINEIDHEMMMTPRLNHIYEMGSSPVNEPDGFFKDNDEFLVDGVKVVVIHTPGHSKGSSCFYLPDENILFAGDTLFKEGIGRCDLAGGSFEEITASIKNRLYTLPDETVVFSGHGEETTIGFEKKNNYYVRA